MSKYSFKFEKVLKLKSDIEEQIKQVYAFYVQKKAALLNENEAIKNNYYENKSDYLNTLAPGDYVSVADLQSLEDYGAAVDLRINNNLDIIRQLDEQIDKLQVELTRATAERKMFEKLKEKDYAEYKQMQSRRENKELDEISAKKYFERLNKEKK